MKINIFSLMFLLSSITYSQTNMFGKLDTMIMLEIHHYNSENIRTGIYTSFLPYNGECVINISKNSLLIEGTYNTSLLTSLLLKVKNIFPDSSDAYLRHVCEHNQKVFFEWSENEYREKFKNTKRICFKEGNYILITVVKIIAYFIEDTNRIGESTLLPSYLLSLETLCFDRPILTDENKISFSRIKNNIKSCQ